MKCVKGGRDRGRAATRGGQRLVAGPCQARNGRSLRAAANGAPTTRFSTFWQSTATRSGAATVTPCAAMSAIIDATSTAAEEETPLPSGTSERMRKAMPASKRTFSSCISTASVPTTYAAHAVDGSAASFA